MDERRPLSGIPLFAGYSPSALAASGLRPRRRALAAGQELFEAGAPREMVWFSRRGWLRTRAHSHNGFEATVELVGPGEMFGGASTPGLASYPCSAFALGEAEAVGVPARAFERWLARHPQAALAVARSLGRRLVELGRLKAINSEPSASRVRHVLAWLSERFGRRVPASRALLSDLTGLRPETCSRALSALRRRGLVRAARGEVELLGPLAAPRRAT